MRTPHTNGRLSVRNRHYLPILIPNCQFIVPSVWAISDPLVIIMQTRTLVFVLVVVGLATATGAVTAMPQADSATTPAQTAAGGGAGGGDTATDPGNYTRLYISDQYRNLRLKPGESDTVSVTVENGEDEAVDLSPRLATPPTRSQPPLNAEWVSIEADDTTLDAEESRSFDVTVEVPDDAEIGQYGGMIAFTDETMQYPGRPPQPIHSATLDVEVWQEPTVEIQSDTHVYTQLKAGETFSRELTIRNTGEEAVPVNPQLNSENAYRAGPAGRATLDRSWVTIDAPSEIAPGETDTVEISVSPPADADRGDYNAQIDLGINDPARANDHSYWQRVDLSFQLWTEPDEPFETSFDVSESTTNATLELTSSHRPRANDGDTNADFDVTFVAPDGREIDVARERLTDTGHVNLGAQRPGTATDGTYAASGGQRTFTYRLNDPQSGEWSVRIMPENTISFEYDLTRETGN